MNSKSESETVSSQNVKDQIPLPEVGRGGKMKREVSRFKAANCSGG